MRLSAFNALLGVSTVLEGRSNVALFEGSLSFDDAAAAFKNAITPIVQQGVDVGLPAIKNGMEAAAPLVKQGFDAALPVMKQAFDASVPILKNGMEAAVPMVKQGVDAALPVMKQAFDASVEVATPVLMQAADSAGAAAGVAAAKAGELLRGSLDTDQQLIFDSATRVSGQIGEVLGVTAKVGLEGVKMGVATVGKVAEVATPIVEEGIRQAAPIVEEGIRQGTPVVLKASEQLLRGVAQGAELGSKAVQPALDELSKTGTVTSATVNKIASDAVSTLSDGSRDLTKGLMRIFSGEESLQLPSAPD